MEHRAVQENINWISILFLSYIFYGGKMNVWLPYSIFSEALCKVLLEERSCGGPKCCLAKQDNLNMTKWHQPEAELHKAGNSTSVLYNKDILACHLIYKEMFLAGPRWEGIRSSFRSWFQMYNMQVSLSNINWSLCSGCFGVFVCHCLVFCFGWVDVFVMGG